MAPHPITCAPQTGPALVPLMLQLGKCIQSCCEVGPQPPLTLPVPGQSQGSSSGVKPHVPKDFAAPFETQGPANTTTQGMLSASSGELPTSAKLKVLLHRRHWSLLGLVGR